MSLENAKKFVSELQTNEELTMKAKGFNNPEEFVKLAAENGYDVTKDELIQLEKAFREERAQKSDEALSTDDLENVAGGNSKSLCVDLDRAPDGNQIGCYQDHYHMDWCKENDIWCSFDFYHKGCDELIVTKVEEKCSYMW